LDVACPVFELLCRIAVAQAQYEGRELRAAMANFQQVYGIGRAVGNRLMSFTGLMAYAHVALDSGRHRRSGLWCLREALAMGEARNYTSYLLWRPHATRLPAHTHPRALTLMGRDAIGAARLALAAQDRDARTVSREQGRCCD